MNRTVSVVVAVLLAPVLLLGAGVLLARTGDVSTSTAAGAPTVPGQEALDSGADPSSAVDALQGRLARLPEDHTAWAALGFAYVAQARHTADPVWYGKAEEALARSLEIEPDANADALAGQAALANARHDFATGRDLALAAVEVDAYDSTARGVLADAQIELGDLDGALDTLDGTMLDLRPGRAVVHAGLLHLRAAGARSRTPATRSSGRSRSRSSDPVTSPSACYHLGDLAVVQGDHAGADAHYDDGLRRVPDQVALLASQASVGRVRSGRTDEALDGVRRRGRAAAATELPGRVRRAARQRGRTDEAAAQYAVADAAAYAVRGVRLGAGRRDGALPGRPRRPGDALAVAQVQYAAPAQRARARRDWPGRCT